MNIFNYVSMQQSKEAPRFLFFHGILCISLWVWVSTRVGECARSYEIQLQSVEWTILHFDLNFITICAQLTISQHHVIWGPSQYKDVVRLTSIGKPMLKIRRSHDLSYPHTWERRYLYWDGALMTWGGACKTVSHRQDQRWRSSMSNMCVPG